METGSIGVDSSGNHTIVFDHRAALETIDDLVGRSGSASITEKPRILLIVPDNLSAARLKEYLAGKNAGMTLGKFHITTFEDLAAAILGSGAKIIDQELLKMIILAAVTQLPDDVSANIRRTLDTENPEEGALLDILMGEFLEYSNLVSPRFRDRNHVISAIDRTLAGLQDALRERAGQILRFYDSLERNCERILQSLDVEPNTFLTRAHLVSEACRKLKDGSLPALINSGGIDGIYVVGIAIFDMTVLDLIVLLLLNCQKFVLNASPDITKRLQSRVKSQLGESFSQVIETGPEKAQEERTTIQAFSVPDRRREVELSAVRCARLISAGTKPEDILLVSRLASDYAPYFATVFQEYGLPHFLQVRNLVSFSPVYRFVESILNLLVLSEERHVLSAEQIASPLRLGFAVSALRAGKRTKHESRLTDSRFLAIETELQRIEKREQRMSPENWLAKINERQKGQSDKRKEFIYRPMIELLSWVKQKRKRPDVDWLISLVRTFIRVYGTEKEFPVLSLIPSGRFDITREHISSQAERILNGLYSLKKRQMQLTSARITLGSAKNGGTWKDTLRVYRGLIGSSSYGETHRDSDAIRFVDAGISHFIQTNHRIVLGLTADQFPRKYPQPFLIFPEMRAEINKPTEGFFITSPETHLEIEYSLFETAKSRAKHLVYSMNYLDDRGHRQLWSYFVREQETNAERVGAHEIRTELSAAFLNKTSPKVYSVNVALFDHLRVNRNRDPDVQLSELSPRLSVVAQASADSELQAIRTSLTALRCRVIHQDFDPELGLIPDDHEKAVFDGSRVPALWELDLNTYCPAMYYFYIFYHFLPNRKWIQQQGLDSEFYFVPAWKTTDYRFGPLPLPLWRTQVSTEGSNWLTKLGQRDSIDPGEVSLLGQEIERLSISKAEKSSLRGLVSILVNMGGFAFKPADLSTSYGSNIHRPPIAHTTGQKDMRVFFKLRAREPIDRTHIINNWTKKWLRVEPQGKQNFYKGFEDTVSIEEATESVRSLKHYRRFLMQRQGDALPLTDELCEACVYRTLCGRWGF